MAAGHIKKVEKIWIGRRMVQVNIILNLVKDKPVIF